jgi:hypothetical protein
MKPATDSPSYRHNNLMYNKGLIANMIEDKLLMRYFLLFVSLLLVSIAFPIVAQDEPLSADETSSQLTVWIPAPLLGDISSDAYQSLIEHTTPFISDNNIAVDYRIKAVGTAGGIMSTIRSGSVVAPGALPDVALIRHTDLILGQTPIYLQSLETLFSSALINDIDNALRLGQVNHADGRQLFGLPYFVDVLVTAYTQADDELDTSLTFEDVLRYSDRFMFPAGRANGLNQTVYLQYLAAGGVPARNDDFNINIDALQTVLKFYESSSEQGLFPEDIMTYNSPSAYRTDFINSPDNQQFAVFSSSEFLSLLNQDDTLQIGSLPTVNGEITSTLDGWVWVMVTPDPRQQDLAVRYLNWMMQPDFHAELANQLFQLPAQQSALENSLPNSVDPIFIESLLNNAILPLPDSEGGTVPRAMQEVLGEVIAGDLTAEEATQQLVEQFGMD